MGETEIQKMQIGESLFWKKEHGKIAHGINFPSRRGNASTCQETIQIETSCVMSEKRLGKINDH